MLSKLRVHIYDRRLLIQCWVGEQQRLPPVAHGSQPLAHLPTPPPTGDGNHLGFWDTLLHENLIVQGYDNRQYKGCQTSGSLANKLIV